MGARKRIIVIGTSGSGKSTFSRKLAARLGYPRIELDALHWEPDWVEASIEVFRERADRATDAPEWVMDGNYGKIRDLTWKKATTLVWLDYSFHIVFGRALFRTVRRAMTRETLWSGNRESFRRSFFSKESILVWVLQTYGRNRREYPKIFERPEYSHLEVLRFRAPAEAASFLEQARSVEGLRP